jgi:hypothetical protein
MTAFRSGSCDGVLELQEGGHPHKEKMEQVAPNNRDISGLPTMLPELSHDFTQGRFLDGVTLASGLVTSRNKCSIAPLRQRC